MSELFSKQRSLPGDVEPFAGRGNSAAGKHADPLAELARLVGRDDPFRKLATPHHDDPAEAERALGSRSSRHTPDYSPEPRISDDGYGSGAEQGDGDAFGFEPPEFDDAPAGRRATRGRGGYGFRDTPGHPSFAPETYASPATTPDAADPFEEFEQAHYEGHTNYREPPPLNADLWAQGMPEPAAAEPLESMHEEDERAGDHSGRRTLVVLAAVLALTAGGLGATFLVHGGSHTNTASGDLPTIMADTAPTKVQPPDTSNASTGGDGNTALLEKSASDNVDNAKVVNTQERPVDLAQLPKPPAVAPEASEDGRVGTSSTMSPFPEPKRVKTIMIRPDGTVVGDDAPPQQDGTAVASSAVGGVTMPAVADPNAMVPPGQIDPIAKPSTPKSTARAATTPRVAATPGDTVASPKAKPAAHPKPAEVADAAPTPAPAADTTASTGGFAVQLAAPTTEKDAKDVMAKLQKKFADDLGSYKPSIHKADRGAKTVFRVRVSNLTQDDAKSLCSKLQADGGSCFVARD